MNDQASTETRFLFDAVAVASGQLAAFERLLERHRDQLQRAVELRFDPRLRGRADPSDVVQETHLEAFRLVTFTLEEGASHVAWSPDAKRLAAAGDGGEVRVWDASRGYEFAEQGGRQGELARAYYQNSRHRDPEMDRARLREVLKFAPDTLGFWELRGHASAKLGDFDRATAKFAKAIEPGIRRSFNAARYYGDALLAAGNPEAYGRHCVAWLNELADTRVVLSGGQVAWACALEQDKRIDSEIVLRLRSNGYRCERRQ